MDNIIVIAGYWPDEENQISGIFVVQQVEALSKLGLTVYVLIGGDHFRRSPVKLSVEKLGLNPEKVKLLFFKNFRLPEKLGVFPGVAHLNARLCGLAVKNKLKHLRCELKNITFIAHGLKNSGLSTKYWKESDDMVAIVIHGRDLALEQKSTLNFVKKQIKHIQKNGNTTFFVVGSPLWAHTKKLGITDVESKVLFNGAVIPGNPNYKLIEKNTEIIILSVSNLTKIKGIDFNIRALHLLKNTHPEIKWKYRIVGDGPERNYLFNLAQELGINEHVQFAGRLCYEQTQLEMLNCDIFSLPSWEEAFGIVYVEAMGAGKPVIGCKNNGPEDFITSGYDGTLINPKNVEELYEAILSYCQDSDTCLQLSKNARKTAENISWERNAQQLLTEIVA